jgi:hypothetical protein
MIDEDLAHEVRGQRDEVASVTHLRRALLNQPYISLMDERGRLQGMAGPLSPQMAPRYLVELVVHQGQQSLQCIAVSGAP